jgi:prefoldin subunit 5
LGNELFAIDGCKLPSNAAKQWSGSFKELSEKRDKLKKLIAYHVTEHQRIDKADTADQEKIKRTQQTIDTLSKAHDKIEKFLNTTEPRKGKGKFEKEVKSNITDNESAKMTTSKGTLQGFNGLAAVDKKHQIIVDAQAFGEGSEQHTLKIIVDKIRTRYSRLNISKNIYKENAIVTADTGFACEENMKYLHDEGINAYIPDNQFRSRDPKFADQKEKYGKRNQDTKKKDEPTVFPPVNFNLIPY